MHTNTYQRNITYNNVLHVTWSEILLNRGFSYIPLYNSLARFSPRIHLCGVQFLHVKEDEILRAPCHRYGTKYRIVMFRRNVTNIFYRVFFGHRLIKPYVRKISKFLLIKPTCHEIIFFLVSALCFYSQDLIVLLPNISFLLSENIKNVMKRREKRKTNFKK